MKLAYFLQKIFPEVPIQIKKFIFRCILAMFLWKVVYGLYLRPRGIIDIPLTNLTANTTTYVLKKINKNSIITWMPLPPSDKSLGHYAVISVNGRHQLGIADACNALELIVLYIGFIFCLPTNIKRQAYFIFGGVLAIFVLNILRCCIMFELSIQKSLLFDFAHHYGFTMVVYAFIFLLWVSYSKSLKKGAN